MTAINLDAMAKGAEELNVQLEAGDVVHVPRAGSIYVGGSVAKPGSLPLKVNTTVHQAILAAGGASNVAALADVRLYRTNPDGQIVDHGARPQRVRGGKGLARAPEERRGHRRQVRGQGVLLRACTTCSGGCSAWDRAVKEGPRPLPHARRPGLRRSHSR